MKYRQLSLNFQNTVTALKTAVVPGSERLSAPDPHSSADLAEIWNRLVDEYFPEQEILKSYKLLWATKIQTRCLASCNIDKKIVRVAPSMKLYEARYFLEPLLYHELCHAVEGIKVVNGRRKIHTREFKALERRHPKIPLLDLWIQNGGWNQVVRKDIKVRKFTSLKMQLKERVSDLLTAL